jgi:protein required for attachment to host cells
MHVKEGAGVVVCDGAKAIILENIGDAGMPDLRLREAEEQPAWRTREIGSDAPGRAFNSVGSVRSAVEQTDHHEVSERTFLTDLARRLDKALTDRETKSSSLHRARLACSATPIRRGPAKRSRTRSTKTSSRCRSVKSNAIS